MFLFEGYDRDYFKDFLTLLTWYAFESALIWIKTFESLNLFEFAEGWLEIVILFE